MTLQQLSTVKRWHLTHHRERSLESQFWDVMLTCWVIGWVGVPVAVLLAPLAGIALCVALFWTPALYVRLRVRLHRRGVLRCDWLGSISPR